ncbi:hypothetical protein H2666_17245 [Vibrio cholerae]|uniref:hypothetical protein n=1 Tax=Vibrio cholerae TaxID=666 RepID=UPI002FDC6ECF|nr:hypothetical protein [Vibrio cholerae]HDI3293387.1 hypothetical protein [Vibrio cholerae]
MNQLFNPDKKFTQSDIAELLGTTDRTVRALVSKGVLPDQVGRNGYNPTACIHSYIAYVRKVKPEDEKPETSDFSEDDFDKVDRQLKQDERRERIAMMKAKRVLFEKSYAPVEVIVETLEQVSSRIGTRLESLLPKLKNAYPELPPEAVETLESVIAAVLNECTDVQPNLSDYMDGDPESSPSWLTSDEEGSTD